ncbi:hypothetical protein UFOVP408_15 [uncultured Caudovirales phage]|uniref:Uncharacterized protein n=1 Tax=uncultured Caudovirales phage TaxID=2100421 RepID=A0A6J5NHH7_9CAUD|nr:hypothetical protein UFOVP356_20 [uncultured Caudovirales phage]CAB4140318.1 hypothetical protein UFOVP408_15 [uncultured Caudovirales phage]CAB4156971.1 hypothetical protein UFOVP676_58 [uncultured Caudovirales phage]
MAESQIAGLFMTPEMYRQQQMQADRQRAAEYAQLAPEQRAAMGFFSAGQGIGRAAGTLLGAQDPQLQRITEQQQMLQGLDVADPDSLMQAARQASQAGNVPLAMQLAQQANQAVQARDVSMQRQLQLNALKEAAEERERARTRQTQAVQLGSRALEQSQTMYGAPAPVIRDDEGNLMPGAGVTSRYNITPEIAAQLSMTPEGRSVLEALLAGQKATRPEVVTLKRGERQFNRDPVSGALTPIALPGQPDAASIGNPIAALLEGGAVPASIQPLARQYATRWASMDPEEQDKNLATLTTKINSANEADQRRRDRLQGQAGVNAAREVTAELARVRIAQLNAEGKRLPPALQKSEDADMELIDSLAARVDALNSPIQALTPDPKTKLPPLQLGPVLNARYQLENATGRSTPQSDAYAALQRAVQEAINLKTDAAKGVQTDRDVLRFANELTAAFGGNDTNVTLAALKNFQKSTQTAEANARRRVDARRTAQGLEPIFGRQSGAPSGRGANALGTPGNPIKLD